MKEGILITNPIKQNPTRIASATPEQQLEKLKNYARRIAQIFRQECINIITKYSVPTIIMRFTIPAMIHNVQFERKTEISQGDGDAELKVTKIPILYHSLLLNSLLIFDDIRSNADIQRFSSGLAKTITHLVSDTFSAESGTVWMYDQNWYDSGDIVPDQVTPASDATPLVDSGTGVAGTSTDKDTSVGTIGTASTYARSDHQHPIQTVDTIPVSDSADGSYGTVESYARNDHSHPINVQTTASIVLIVNGVGNNGTQAYYSRHDHIHPQQLTYDGNITTTKFIKTGGLPTEVLCANGDTTTIDNKFSKTFSASTGGWIRLCVFPTGASVGSPFIEFKLYTMYNAVQTIRLLPYYTVNGINTVHGIFTAPTNVSSYYDNVNVTNYVLNVGSSDSFAGVTCGSIQINPTASSFDDGLRISRTIENTGSFAIFLGCSRTSNTGAIAGQWSIYTSTSGYVNNPLGFKISFTTETGDNTRGLQISADGNTLTFNGRVL
ncbi:MAG: hypothetical protein EZS28_013978 [Streblomastix strix]|uniref:Uncharacterized protein n=1 Tax=Streblomastix strix TaxID=222440 RepID=A0A5J4W7G0_9EUKA|nr:MAG: hypothetical protein EZS28_013978 [Streblomastix strix]